MAFNADSGPALQAQLDADPEYQRRRQKFLGSKAPLDWLELARYANQKFDAGANTTRTGALQIDGDGNVQMMNRDNKWTSPGTWGPIAVGVAGGVAALGGMGSSGATVPAAVAGTEATTGVGPLAGGLAGATTEATIPASLAATSAAPAAATAAPLASTTIGTGAAAPITGGTGMSGGSSVGWLNNLKTAYDWYNKGSQVYDSVKGQGGPSPGQALTQTAGSIENGRLNALIQQARLQQEQDQLGLSRTNAGVNVGNLDLNRRKFAQGVPGQLANDSARGDILANSQDAQVSGLPSYIHVGQVSGGLRPSLLSPNTRQLGAKMSRDALASSMSGDQTKFPALPSVPDATPLPEANGTDTALQWASGAGSILDTLGRFGTSGKSKPGVEPGGYLGPGTEGYPGDTTSGVNNPVAPPPYDTNGPNEPLPSTQVGTGMMDPSVLEWLKRNGQGAPA